MARRAVPSAWEDESIRSTSTLNQRSTVCWMRSLPTTISSREGATRHEQEDEDELHAEPRAEHAAAPLQHHPHQVPAEDEDEDEEEGEVQDGQAVEQDGGEEVGREVPALAEEDLERDEDGQDPARGGQDEAGVVPEFLFGHPRVRRGVPGLDSPGRHETLWPDHCSLGATPA